MVRISAHWLVLRLLFVGERGYGRRSQLNYQQLFFSSCGWQAVPAFPWLHRVSVRPPVRPLAKNVALRCLSFKGRERPSWKEPRSGPRPWTLWCFACSQPSLNPISFPCTYHQLHHQLKIIRYPELLTHHAPASSNGALRTSTCKFLTYSCGCQLRSLETTSLPSGLWCRRHRPCPPLQWLWRWRSLKKHAIIDASVKVIRYV